MYFGPNIPRAEAEEKSRQWDEHLGNVIRKRKDSGYQPIFQPRGEDWSPSLREDKPNTTYEFMDEFRDSPFYKDAQDYSGMSTMDYRYNPFTGGYGGSSDFNRYKHAYDQFLTERSKPADFDENQPAPNQEPFQFDQPKFPPFNIFRGGFGRSPLSGTFSPYMSGMFGSPYMGGGYGGYGMPPMMGGYGSPYGGGLGMFGMSPYGGYGGYGMFGGMMNPFMGGYGSNAWGRLNLPFARSGRGQMRRLNSFMQNPFMGEQQMMQQYPYQQQPTQQQPTQGGNYMGPNMNNSFMQNPFMGGLMSAVNSIFPMMGQNQTQGSQPTQASFAQ